MPRLVAAALSVSMVLAVPFASAQSTAPDAASSGTPSVSADATTPDSTAPGALEEVAHRLEDPFGTYVQDHADDYVGTGESFYPYEREFVIYRAGPPLRYNRVEGVVLGLRREPLSLGAEDPAQIYGQIGYAFALKDLRYTIGVESQLIRDRTAGLKFGVVYQKQTLTFDRWKTSYAENSLAGLGFEYDFFDYYEAQGLSIYAVQALSRTFRLTAGFRTVEHRSLALQTRWSLFGTGAFRDNPAAQEGRLNAAFLGLRGGHIQDPGGLPTGAAVHFSATVGEPFGGTLSVNRYEVDGRLFVPLTPDTRLGLRIRGGYATSEAPIQTQFTLGGIGSVRGYAQNEIRGTRMLLGNVEYMVDGATLDDDFLDDLFLVGLFDAGWVGRPGERFRVNDVLLSAGFGVGLDEREVRLDVSWPLRDHPAAKSGPSIWLRITPNF